MKKLASIIFLLFSQTLFAQTSLERVEPAFWWAGMQNNELQLLVYGQDIANLDVSLDYPGVKLKQVIKVENPNYLFLNLELNSNVNPGTFNISFKEDDKIQHSYKYELRERESDSRERIGFNATDVMYLIAPDRFVNGNPDNDEIAGMKEKKNRNFNGGRHGGDIQGIVNSLDYISEMGFTAIWLNPVLENDMNDYSYHGYAATDFYKVDQRLGSNEEYVKLSLKAKEEGIKIIMDMIVNHCGSEHWWMNDLPTSDWINNNGKFFQTSHKRQVNVDPYVSKYDKFHNSDGWFVETMPDLNQRNELMATYLIQNTIWWIEYAHLDGIRMDTWPYPDKIFMNDWCEAVLAEYPYFNVVGEEWTVEPAIVSYWQQGKVNLDSYHCNLPSLMDFPMQEAIVEGVKNDGTKTYETLAMDFLYPSPQNLVVFLDNHDMSRIFTQLDEDFDAYKRALAYLTVLRGTPQIFYGTEILMSHKGSEDHGDIRADFPGGWKGDKINVFTGKGLTTQQKEAQNFMKNLLNWRKKKDVIHHGRTMQFAPLYDEEVYTLARYNDKDLVLLIMNNSDEEVAVKTSRYAELTKDLNAMIDVIKGQKINISAETVTIPANGFLLLEK
ncbi:glycosidase [Balneicella halophila]|uniref:Glycosidase n=1 Tax=Balneicella halophila TaxID=1537566 RepID=A0A7L4UQN0_BALHA|nr:glycoside hydrolase family 13 protein [Balneicella halophila]PVX51751.1 glycosidase [Balneicella halophila]